MYTKAHYFLSQARNLWRLGLLGKETKLKKKIKTQSSIALPNISFNFKHIDLKFQLILNSKEHFYYFTSLGTTKNVLFVFRFHVSFVADEVQLVFMLTNSFSAMQSACHGFSSLIRGLLVYIKFYVLLKSNTLYLHHISCAIPLFTSYLFDVGLSIIWFLYI